MCAVCFQWEKGKLSKGEARAALSELVDTGSIDWEHVLEVRELIEETE